MTISTYDDLRQWFYGNSRKGNSAPYWTLFGQPFGSKEFTITRNDTNSNVDESWDWLHNTIKRVNNPGGQRFRILQVDIPAGNNPVGQVFIQIHDQNTAAVIAGISGIGGNTGIGKDEVSAMIAEARSKWEMEKRIEDLEAQINAPGNDPMERTMQYVERIAQTPIGAAIVAKLTGIPIPMPSVGNADGDSDGPTDDDNEFYENISTVARKLGTTEHMLAKKLKNLVNQHPDMAAQLLNT